MAYKITKQLDGDVSLGSLNGEFVNLQPATSDYPTGGYAIVDEVSVVDNPSLNANCDLYRLLTVIPAGGQLGYVPSYVPSTKKLEMYQQNATTGQLQQVPAGTDLSALTFSLLLVGL
jgi:hypothetical protein